LNFISLFTTHNTQINHRREAIDQSESRIETNRFINTFITCWFI